MGLHVMGGFSSPSIPQSTTVLGRADSSVGELVNTPNGPIPKSNVHLVPEGSRVEQTDKFVNIISANGTVLYSTEITHGNAFRNLQSRQIIDEVTREGYVELAYWGNTDPSPIAYFTTLWSVPNIPERLDGQYFYIFNGLEPQSQQSIFQPVLQFGVTPAGGGNFWAVASWWVVGTTAFHTPITRVNVGQTLIGAMSLQSTTTSAGVTSYRYNSNFTGIPASSLSITTTEELTITFEALEVYNITTRTQLPRGRTGMRTIDIVLQNGKRPTVNWEVIANTEEGFNVSVVSNAVPNGQVDLIYPLQ